MEIIESQCHVSAVHRVLTDSVKEHTIYIIIASPLDIDRITIKSLTNIEPPDSQISFMVATAIELRYDHANLSDEYYRQILGKLERELSALAMQCGIDNNLSIQIRMPGFEELKAKLHLVTREQLRLFP